MLIELLKRGAANGPDHRLVDSRAGGWTYAACLDRAEAVAHGLRERGVDRFACVIDDVGELIALLCGASAAGSEACVYPGGLEPTALEELATVIGHSVLITDRGLPSPGEGSVLTPDELGDAGPGAVRRSESAPVLVLTTGTTGRPKGVRHEWSQLVRPVERLAPQPEARWLLAYNLNQFGGIQILLHVLATGATMVVGETRHPGDGLVAMRELGVTHVSATPTFWRMVTGRLDAQTAREVPLEQITLGGEAVPQSLLDAIRGLFPDVPVSQIYGANEFGTAVSVRDGLSGLPLSVLDRDDESRVRFRIVDGELQVHARTGETDQWRPTGDLVEVRGDRIHFVGRTTEIINVGGVKVHPLPVEEVIAGVAGVELVRVYGRANAVAGQIVAADVVARAGIDGEALRSEIRTACEVLPPASRPRSLRLVDALELRDTKLARPGAKA